MRTNDETTDPNEIIDALGGTSAVAELFDVTTGAVSQWRLNGIPDARLMYLRVARPDVLKKSKAGRRAMGAA